MKNKYIKLKAIVILLLVVSINLNSQSEPFNCVTEAYLFQSNDVYAQNLASGNATLEGIDIDPSIINGVGYNPKDGYIWGSLKSPSNTIIRIGNNYETTHFTLSNAPYSYVGDVNQDGIYFLKNGSSSFYKIDLDPSSPNYLTNIGTVNLSQAISNHDWAFNAVDDMLYTVEKYTNILYKIDPVSGNVQALGEVPILSGLDYTYGAVYFDVDGNFYISANQTGTVYVIYGVQNVTSSLDMQSNLFAYGPSSSQNDGARCPTAPVPQENCTNGIDDDGDGLIDCDDPSCSGVASCPEMSATSTGNDGGLESNNRLSQQINQRNLNRVKTNYKFEVSSAKKIIKKASYGKKSTTEVTLWDFIPMEVIENTYVVESSPTDLKDITNAVDVLSVDYITTNNEGLGTIMVLETENSVYEHTKHICDRFTGAELLSVSNMEINDQVFIKSIVKRPDGGIEYVASFSVSESQDKNSFIVESHWNLDKYSQKGFYNFQIWASSIDHLYKLSKEVLDLINVQKEISSYISSEAPPVFIRKATYNNGKIDMEVVSTIGATTISIDGYKRATETSESENLNFTVALENSLNTVSLETDKLYDFGFRLSNEYGMTPDDLFLSDGTWGIDYSSESFVSDFSITQNATNFGEEAYQVERNMAASFLTNQDVSIYRSLTPKFEKVDLSDYDIMSFIAKGTGKLKITLIKESISSWDNQPYIIIDLKEDEKEYALLLSDFNNMLDNESLTDVKMLFFTMLSESSIAESKFIEMNSLHFLKGATASVVDNESNNIIKIVPNPVVKSSQLKFHTQELGKYSFEVYTIFGKQVHKEVFESNLGANTLIFNRNDLAAGIYFFKIYSGKKEWKGKLLLR
ncbi:putative secreted protein (Por secretion system target) [Tenacibaculum skagerrakense]|uniref:Putative secreted protein (Por secretion system target) n=1 Tax=Tenacibaculum skagerrakense TaxID=186571 RepID=A0A4V2SLQ7_9FLAO|nr:T9SS type A sorting domain-containing protein [Tenacibaculum skagerrakense]TCP24386.1 putative secreted protein (Por secretion system target) [Tenacibaculum skagerrakense]